MQSKAEEGIGDDGDRSQRNHGILSRMGLNDNKAGMEGLDKEKINKIILENSIGSKFYENERKKDAQVNARVTKLLERVESFTPEQKDSALGQTNKILNELESGRDLRRTIVHIDMDAFYASVEERDQPDLKTKPMAVGGMDMLSTSNYIARRYGVRAAMPGFIGKKLCPDLVLVRPNFAKYTEVSQVVRKVLSNYDPNLMPMSLDEAYLDLTPYLETRSGVPEVDRTFLLKDTTDGGRIPSSEGKIVFGNTAEEVVKEIRFRIQQETSLTASAGIAPNTLLAKVASDMNKPNGQYYLPPIRENVMEFIKKLPIRKVGGIGKVTEKLLNALDVFTCQDLYDQRAILYLAFSETMSSSFLRMSIGISSTILEGDSERKSISTERTFREISSPNEMYKKCEELCDSLEEDAMKQGIRGLTITLKLKTSNFELYTRSKTVMFPVGCKSEIYPIAVDLLKQELSLKNNQLKLRLMGVGLSKLSKGGDEPQQKSINYFLQKGVKRKLGDSAVEADDNVIGDQNLPDCEDDTQMDPNDTNTPESSSVLEDDALTKSLSSTEFICPICNAKFGDLDMLQMHVDTCVTHSSEISNLPQSVNRDKNDIASEWGRDISCLTCPLCNATFCSKDISLDKFNSHVDSCLNRQTIRELVKEQSNEGFEMKSRSGGGDCAPPKKRKKTSAPKPSCTLDKFFK